MTVATGLVYDIRPLAEVRPCTDGVQLVFANGGVAFLAASHPKYETLRLHAEHSRGPAAPVGVVLDPAGRVVDLNSAHDTAVQSVQPCPEDPRRLKVAFWGYSPVCYLTVDHPDFERIRTTLQDAVATRSRVWVANHSEMVEDEPATEEGEFELWWKILDVRPI